jgi:hypothetical protein
MIFLISLIVNVIIVNPNNVITNTVATRNHIGNITQNQLIGSISTNFKNARKKVKYIDAFSIVISFLNYG